ncbi:ROK family protein [Paracoccus aurantiacus]|uniref:N-acetylglucosamine kinase n=1 Tax=Paracoccus aurantiacus TaxID=2599412 RepID=A0A5C6S497_9RHOB|nr:ROK family protein [Paracoccus aurantiacus]TXB69279.1 ROK family protein [Paracoccus aurantiacus]
MILCFDIGGSAIKIAHAHAVDDIRTTGTRPTPGRDRDAFMAVLKQALQDAPQPPRRVAVSIAGVIDPDTGRAQVANIPCLNERALHAELEGELGLPVDLANDADCFALAEAVTGAGRGHDVVLGLILGTGVGGGLVIRGELINASGGFAGEWGHGPVAQRTLGQPPVSLPVLACGCGQSGCLDTLCGARGMEALHRHLHDNESLDSRAIVEGWQAGNPNAMRTIEIWTELLAGPLSMIQNLIGADVMTVGGGLSNSAPLIAGLDRATRARILRRITRPLIVPAECRIEPGLVGAAILAFRQDQR